MKLEEVTRKSAIYEITWKDGTKGEAVYKDDCFWMPNPSKTLLDIESLEMISDDYTLVLAKLLDPQMETI